MPWTWQSTPQHEPCCPESLGDIIYSLIQGVYHASISSSEIILEKFLFIKVLLRRWTGSWTPRMRTKAERVRVIQQLKWRVFWELIFKNTTLNIDYSDLRQTYCFPIRNALSLPVTSTRKLCILLVSAYSARPNLSAICAEGLMIP